MMRFFLIWIFVFFSSNAFAADVRVWRLTQVVGDHQDSTSMVIIDREGNATFTARFSNGHQTDGDHFAAEVVGNPKHKLQIVLNKKDALVQQSCRLTCSPSDDGFGGKESQQCQDVRAISDGFGIDRPKLIIER